MFVYIWFLTLYALVYTGASSGWIWGFSIITALHLLRMLVAYVADKARAKMIADQLESLRLGGSLKNVSGSDKVQH